MKKIIVTPAGRKKYLSVLRENLLKFKDEFDEWHIWKNTDNKEDLNYINSINDNFVKKIPLTVGFEKNYSIYSFFKNCTNPNEVYLRLDDDIVFINKHSIKNLFNFRLKNEQYFLVYGNVINNAICTHIHQRQGAFKSEKIAGYNCMDRVGWHDGEFALKLHQSFKESYKNNTHKKYYFNEWVLFNYERVSINAISWLGKEFEKFNGDVGEDEEQWLSCVKPKELQKPNVIFGNENIFVHYAFYTQRDYLEKNLNIDYMIN